MNKPLRTTLIAGSACFATAVIGSLVANTLLDAGVIYADDVEFLFPRIMLLGVAIGLGTAGVWSHVEESAARRNATPATPEGAPSLRFCSTEPQALRWGPGLASASTVLAGFEGDRLHRRLAQAAQELTARDGEFQPLDGLHLADDDGPFQAHVESLRVQGQDAVNRWLIIVSYPAMVGEEFTATTFDGCPRVSEPAVVAAVVTYKNGTRNQMISVDELHALDAAYVAACAMSAWQCLAYRRGLETVETRATATLAADGITWDVLLHVPMTETGAEAMSEPLRDLLGGLRAPVDAWVAGTLPEDEAQDEDGDEDQDADRDDA